VRRIEPLDQVDGFVSVSEAELLSEESEVFGIDLFSAANAFIANRYSALATPTDMPSESK